MEDEIHVSIETDADLVVARAEGRAMAQRLGFRPPDPTLIATAISEVARNIMSNVKFAVESALGVPVVQVNVNVQDIRVSEEGGREA